MKVIVDQAFWDLFPTASITVMSLYGIDNTVDEAKDPYFKELLDKGAKRAWEFIDEENYTQSEFVQEWRQAFGKFKTKKGARSSIEALLNGFTRDVNSIRLILWWIFTIVCLWLMPFLVGEKIWINWWVASL